MDIFIKILGLAISLGLIYVGIRFAFSPVKSIQFLQKIKYRTTGGVGKREKIMSLITGILFIIIGLYYLALVIMSFIIPA